MVERHIYLLACASKAVESRNSLRLVQCYSYKVAWSTPAEKRVWLNMKYMCLQELVLPKISIVYQL